MPLARPAEVGVDDTAALEQEAGGGQLSATVDQAEMHTVTKCLQRVEVGIVEVVVTRGAGLSHGLAIDLAKRFAVLAPRANARRLTQAHAPVDGALVAFACVRPDLRFGSVQADDHCRHSPQ